MPVKFAKKSAFAICLFTACSGIYIYGDNKTKLPTEEILGNEYYIYEVKKGESIYGIAKKNGWNLEELMRLNPEVSGNVSKGDRLYYPTGKVSVVTENPRPIEIDESLLQPIKHKVKKGETIYSISRQYNVPLDVIYKNNPSARKGVKTGEIVEIPQNGNSQYYFYTVKPGDRLSTIAQQYNTSVEDILKDNPGLSVNNFKEGETIRIPVNSNVGKVKTELVAEERVSGITGYKVSKNETWDEISEKTGVEVEVLKEANNDAEEPVKNTIINVPTVEVVEVEKTVEFVEQKDLTIEEVVEIYDSLKNGPSEERIFDGVRMALILDEPNSNKDIDFTRGVLVALSQMTGTAYKIDLNVLDGRVSTGDLIKQLDAYEPNLIVTTADKAFPLFLADYGNTNNIQIVNVFDLKNDLYEDNASIIQLLPPSSYFNDRISHQIYTDNKRRKFISVGEPDENDGIGNELYILFDDNHENMTLETFGSLEPDIMEPVLIYSYATKKEEIADFFTNVDSLSENNPGFDFKIIGRSNWIAMVDDFNDKFEEYSVYLPSRVWMEEDSKQWKNFYSSYEEMFGGLPVRSIPNFAVSGYDVAEYFIPMVAYNRGDFNHTLLSINPETLQNDFNLKRVNNWGGFINTVGYLVKFGKDGQNEKIWVK